MNNDIESVLYSKEQIEERMDELSGEITKKYKNEMPLVVSVMNGAMIFTSDMLRRLNFKLNLDIIKASSYQGAHSTGEVKIMKDLLVKRGAKSVEICAMLDKPETRTVDLKGDYIGFNAPNEFIVGYGLDYDGLYRNLPYIGILKKQIYA